MATTNSQKGVSLYMALMIMTILLVIAFGISTILFSELKMLRGMGESVNALYAADTGVEKILWDTSQGIDIIAVCASPCTGNLGPETTYSVIVIEAGQPGCTGASFYCIKSIGTYKETKRSVQANI